LARSVWSQSFGAQERAGDFQFWPDLFGLGCFNHSILKIFIFNVGYLIEPKNKIFLIILNNQHKNEHFFVPLV
jgi:hypothetical protein